MEVDFHVFQGASPRTGPVLWSRVLIRTRGRNPVEDTVSFSLPTRFRAHNDCVAGCLATLCARFEKIRFHFPTSARCRQLIAEAYDAQVTSDGPDIAPRLPGKRKAISFSGGFDSLAAHLLAGEQLQLISVDFGGAFVREARFFSKFRPQICRTNIRQRRWAIQDWRFMGAASCLYAHHLDLGTLLFGGIFEASYWSFADGIANRDPRLSGPFGAAGLVSSSLVQGLTEFGTAMVVQAWAPQLLRESLAALAAPGSEKAFRKQLLLDAVRHRFGGAAPEFSLYKYPRRRLRFGDAFTVDFLTLYFVSVYGRRTVARWIDDVPDVRLGDLDFVFKFNPLFVRNIPPELRVLALNRMAAAGIGTYGEQDWKGFNAVKAILARHYPIAAHG